MFLSSWELWVDGSTKLYQPLQSICSENLYLPIHFWVECLSLSHWSLYSIFSSFLFLFSIWFQFWCFSLTLSDLFYRYAINNEKRWEKWNYFTLKRNIWGWLTYYIDRIYFKYVKKMFEVYCNSICNRASASSTVSLIYI